MAIVITHPQSYTTDEMNDIKNGLTELFVQQNGAMKSLYFQALGAKKPEEPPVEHLSGAKHLREKLCGLEFSISPQAFFQV